MEAAIEKNSVPTWTWADVALSDKGDLNAVMFSSGFGDGSYPVYLSPAGVLLDFGIFGS
jgi:hypothetical protein